MKDKPAILPSICRHPRHPNRFQVRIRMGAKTTYCRTYQSLEEASDALLFWVQTFRKGKGSEND